MAVIAEPDIPINQDEHHNILIIQPVPITNDNRIDIVLDGQSYRFLDEIDHFVSCDPDLLELIQGDTILRLGDIYSMRIRDYYFDMLELLLDTNYTIGVIFHTICCHVISTIINQEDIDLHIAELRYVFTTHIFSRFVSVARNLSIEFERIDVIRNTITAQPLLNLEPVRLVLSQRGLDSIPSVQYGSLDSSSRPSNESCPICITEYTSDDMIRIFGCGHSAHTECCTDYFTQQNHICMYCRESVGEYMPLIENPSDIDRIPAFELAPLSVNEVDVGDIYDSESDSDTLPELEPVSVNEIDISDIYESELEDESMPGLITSSINDID